jgi:hypothetical protein
MANTFRIKRRTTGLAGAPTSLANAELAFNEVEDTLYYGKGTGGAGGTATTVEAIGGKGMFVDRTSNQNFGGDKTFWGDSWTFDAGTTVYFNGVNFEMTSATGAVNVPTPLAADNSFKAANTSWVRGFAQPLDSDLTALAGISTAGLLARTGAGTAAARTLTGTSGRISLSNGDGVSGNPTIDLAASGVTAGTWTKITVDTYGRATVGATASISDLSVPTGAVSFNSQKITNLATPTAATDAATKGYVDTAVQGLSTKESVRVATTANIASLSTLLTVDGVTVAANDRVLVKNQSTASQNGIYIAASGAWTRAADMAAGTEAGGSFVFVEEGTTNADSGWVCTSNTSGGASTVGTDNLAFTQFSGAGQITAGAGLTKTGNTLDIGAGTGITVNADTIQISATYAGQSSITTLGTITSGAWNGNSIPVAHGGTGANSASQARINLGLQIGVNVQAYSEVLLNLELGYGLSDATRSPGEIVIGAWTCSNTSTGAYTEIVTGTTGRALLTATSAAAGRTTLGLGTIATQAASSVAITGGSIDNITFDGGSF